MPKAIACYQSQTYQRRELLILADGESVRDLIPLDDPSIRLVEIAGNTRIGAKRNLGCEKADGEIVAHFDDDDFSAPERLSDQVSRLIASNLPVTGYREMQFRDGAQAWLYTGTPLFVLGTSLCYRRDYWRAHRFMEIQMGEDNHFVHDAAAAGQLAPAPAGDLMWASIHAGNTSPRQRSGTAWKLL